MRFPIPAYDCMILSIIAYDCIFFVDSCILLPSRSVFFVLFLVGRTLNLHPET